MAFANLFKGLSPVVEDVKSPAQPVSTLRYVTTGEEHVFIKHRHVYTYCALAFCLIGTRLMVKETLTERGRHSVSSLAIMER